MTSPDPVDPAVGRPQRGDILVVEDSPVGRLVARRILAHLSYRVDVATNGLEALEAMAGTDYAAVLMDCEMPQMDGYAATAEIRCREGDRRHTPIIAMTASDSSAHRERCMDAGMDDYIVKPAQSADLDVVLAKWVGSLAPPGDQT